MNPAYSVIFFTVASGAGYGLLALSALAAASHGKASSAVFAGATLAISLGLISAGLLSSTAHLGRPERAWQAFSQWRSSWLSREAVAAMATYPVALAFGAVWSGLIEAPGMIAPLGTLTALFCAITVYCTGMIYAVLKPIPAWHNRFTVPVYMVFALATGASLLAAISTGFGRFQAGAGPFLVVLSVVLLAAALMLKFFYWRQVFASYSLGQATGLGQDVRQWEVPHTATNFIMKEMGYSVARAHALRLRRLVLMLLALALMASLASLAVPAFSFIAAVLALAAAWVERWLFFAMAEHVSGLFYGR